MSWLGDDVPVKTKRSVGSIPKPAQEGLIVTERVPAFEALRAGDRLASAKARWASKSEDARVAASADMDDRMTTELDGL